MRSLFKNVANELIQQMTPEDLKEIMDSTVVTVLDKMGPQERLEFSKAIVNNAVNEVLTRLDEEQRVDLLSALLPTLLQHLEIDLQHMSPAEIAAILNASSNTPSEG